MATRTEHRAKAEDALADALNSSALSTGRAIKLQLALVHATLAITAEETPSPVFELKAAEPVAETKPAPKRTPKPKAAEAAPAETPAAEAAAEEVAA